MYSVASGFVKLFLIGALALHLQFFSSRFLLSGTFTSAMQIGIYEKFVLFCFFAMPMDG